MRDLSAVALRSLAKIRYFVSAPALYADDIGKFRSILSILGAVKLACPFKQRTT
jgi:hypothetical protein